MDEAATVTQINACAPKNRQKFLVKCYLEIWFLRNVQGRPLPIKVEYFPYNNIIHI